MIRLSTHTTTQFDALKARVNRLQSKIGSGISSEALLRAGALEAAEIARDAKALQLMLRQEAARDIAPPEPIPLRAGRGR